MKKSLIFLLVLLAFLTVEAKTLNECFQIIPKPQQIEVKKGSGLKFGDLCYVSIPDTVGLPVLEALLDALPRVSRLGEGVILELTDKHVPESVEGYILESRPEGVTITSAERPDCFTDVKPWSNCWKIAGIFTKRFP